MLILVGVTVTTTINGGLFEKAKEAATGTEIAREKEELTLAIVTAYNVGTKKVDKEKLEGALPSDWTVKENEDGSYTAKSPKGNNYKITSSRTILEENTLAYIYCPKEDCTDNTHLHKGDYVNYTPKTEKTAYAPDKGEGIGKYTGYTKTTAEQSIPQEDLNWRVLGQDDKGNILLISGAPTKTELRFKGYVGYNNYETVLKDTCEALYSNTTLGATARSITMEDINKYLGGSNYKKEDFGGGSGSEAGYGYQNASAITSQFKYNKKTNILTKESCTIPAKDLESNAYFYQLTEALIGAKNKEILLGKENGNACFNWVATREVYVNRDSAYWCFTYVGYGYVGANNTDFLCTTDGNEWWRRDWLSPRSFSTIWRHNRAGKQNLVRSNRNSINMYT